MTEVVIRRQHSRLPYSRGVMAQSIMATGIAPARAYDLARQIGERLKATSGGDVSISDLRALTEATLMAEEGSGAVERFRAWQRLDRLDRPLVVLIGGTAGTGKSTLATSLAHRLGISRLTSTDIIRNVLRAFFSLDVMPDVHYSSFEAGRAVRLHDDGEDVDLLGFRVQAEHVVSGVGAIIDRAVQERTPLILEGVHLVPGILPAELLRRGLVVQVVLAVRDEATHRSHFTMRSEAQARGPSSRYLDQLDRIRKLQGYLVERAEREGVRVLVNDELDKSLATLLDMVIQAVAASADGERVAPRSAAAVTGAGQGTGLPAATGGRP